MAKITLARLIGKREVGPDLFEYGVRFYGEDGAEVSLGEGGDDVVIVTSDDLEEGTTHLYFTEDRVNTIIDDRTEDDVALKSEVTSGLAAKADSSAMTSALANKASISYVDGAVATKMNTADVEDALADKADITYVDGAVVSKANTTDVTAALADKADTSYVDGVVAPKANASDVATALAAKAATSYVDTAVAGLASTSAVNAGLATKRDQKNQAKVTLDSDTDFVEKFEVINDGTATSTWPNRKEYGCTPVGGATGGASRIVQYLNEYFEWRGNARQNTVLWRAFVREFPADAAHDMATPIWEVQNDRTNRVVQHAMYGQGNFYHLGDGTVDGNLAVGGNVTADNIGVPILGVYDTGDEPTGVPTGTVILVRP